MYFIIGVSIMQVCGLYLVALHLISKSCSASYCRNAGRVPFIPCSSLFINMLLFLKMQRTRILILLSPATAVSSSVMVHSALIKALTFSTGV